jgi:hypothetical protein
MLGQLGGASPDVAAEMARLDDAKRLDRVMKGGFFGGKD